MTAGIVGAAGAGVGAAARRLADALLRGEKAVASGIVGGATGLLLAHLAAHASRPLIVVVPDGLRAALLADALSAFLGDPDAAASFPPFEHLPFQGMSPPHGTVAERMGLLARLAAGVPPRALVIPAATLLDRVPPRAAVRAHSRTLRPGETIPRAELLAFLVATGHVRVPQVDDVGAFAVRGDVVDVFPAGHAEPIRLEFFDDELESIRPFDPGTQATRQGAAPLDECRLGPARDVFVSLGSAEAVRAGLQALADQCGTPSSRVRALAADLERGIVGAGMEDLLPAFHGRLETLFDYLDALPEAPVLVLEDPARSKRAMLERALDLERRAARARAEPGALVFPVDAAYASSEGGIGELEARAGLHLSAHREFEPGFGGRRLELDVEPMQPLRAAIEAAMREGALEVMAPLVSRAAAWRAADARVIICAPSPGGIERVRALLGGYPFKLEVHTDRGALARLATTPPGARPADEPTRIDLVVAHVGEGFDWSRRGLVVIDHTELFGKPPAVRRRVRRPPPELAIQSWRDLKVGDLVVHLERGVGRYLGLDTYVARGDGGGGIRSDLIVLEYAGGDRLYVPIEKLHLVSKHQGGDGAPALDRLGGPGWQKTKSRVTKAVRDIADKLIRLHAEREARRGVAFHPPCETFRRFEAAFPWDETADQARAIDDVLADLQRPRPMDRLVCGDVGFGKTEVAMRAAMKVVVDGWQVLVVVPTQVLAEQHRRVFERRFEGFPILIASLTGTQPAKVQKAVADDLAAGRVDIVIGTHRLLSRDIAPKRLGLLIIDEEHRFGVAQKERLRELRPTVDVLTLTATPIPRTLHMSMIGLRDISLIQTPPTDRLPVETFLAQPTDEVIAEAIRRELLRGGQVFFVHHRVSDIERYAELIGNLVPEARVAVGHGQMPPGTLDRVMARFVSGEANVLVATTIIESGIDISTANTMIIHRADCFGLAQLHQLRGRVGRSDTRAYCYLLVPPLETLGADAEQRLLAIQQFTELGSGFSIASHDLDIRGAGDILGADQAGNINAIGFEAYTALLQEAVAALREGGAADDGTVALPDPELRIAVEARIPEAWLPDMQLRLRLYRRLSAAESDDELGSVLADIVDRYGAPPEPVLALHDIMRLKLVARRMHLKSISLGPTALQLGLSGRPPLDMAALTAILPGQAGWRLSPEGALIIPRGPDAPAAGRAGIASVLEALLALDHSAMASRLPGARPPGLAAAGARAPHGGTHEASPTPRAARPRPDAPHGPGMRQGRPSRDEPRPGRRVVDVDPDPRRRKSRDRKPGG